MSGKEQVSVGIAEILDALEKFNGYKFVKATKPSLMIRLDSAAFTSLLWMLSKINESGEFAWSPSDQMFKAGIQDAGLSFYFKFTWRIEKENYENAGTKEVRYPARFKEMANILKTAGTAPRERLFHPSDMPTYTLIFDPNNKQITVKDNFEIIDSENDNYILRFKDPSLIDEPYTDMLNLAVHDYVKLKIDVKKFLTILEAFKKDKQMFITLLPGKESAEFRGAPFSFNFNGEGKLGKATVKDSSMALESMTREGESSYDWEQAYKTYAKYFVLEKKVRESTASLSEVAEFTRLEDLRNKFTYSLPFLHTAITFLNKAGIESGEAIVKKEGVLYLHFTMLDGKIHGMFLFAAYPDGAAEQYVFTSEESHSYNLFDPESIYKPDYSNYYYLKDEWKENLISRIAEHYGFKSIAQMVESIKLSDVKIASEEEKSGNEGLVASFTINLKIPEDIQAEFKLKEITSEEEESSKPLAALALDTFLVNLAESSEDERSKRKGYRTLQKRYDEHEAKLDQIIREGGRASSVIKEMGAFLKQKMDYKRDLGEPISRELVD